MAQDQTHLVWLDMEMTGLDPDRDRNLRAIDAGHLFAINLTRLAFRRGAYLRGYAYGFMETFAPPLTREVVEQAVRQSTEVAAA